MENTSSYGLQLLKGIVLIILGVLAISTPTLTTYALNLVLGWLFVVGGIAIILESLFSEKEGVVWLNVLLGIFALICGAFLLVKPLAGSLALSTLLTAYLFAHGVSTVLFWTAVRKVDGAGWIGLNGVVTILLAILIMSQWPIGGLIFVGVVIGLHLIFWGTANILFALASRK